MSKDNKIFVYQIYYDQASKQLLDPGFIPLDNTSNERPDWFEFWVIRNFLNSQQLDESAWYGFLSPKFRAKTGLTSQQVIGFVNTYAMQCEVALFSSCWDQNSYFQNPFEQGDMWHPGLLDLSQSFLDAVGMKLDIRSLVTDTSTTALGNYIVAKPVFWRAWLDLANKFFEMVEKKENTISDRAANLTSYSSRLDLAPMKAFLQERLATAIIAKNNFRVAAWDQSSYSYSPIFTRLFHDDFRTRRLLQACNLLKQQYNLSQDKDYFLVYQKLRKQIAIKPIC